MRVSTIAALLLLTTLFFSAASMSSGQGGSQTCPAYTQIPGDTGMANNAKATMYLANSQYGNWTSAQITNASDTLNSVMAIQNSGITQNPPQNAAPTQGGSPSAPVMVVQMANQTTISNACPHATSPVACTQPIVQGTTTIGSVTYILPSYAGNVTALLNEFGHSVFGWADCSGANCQNTIMQPTTANSMTGPTTCDKQNVKSCGR